MRRQIIRGEGVQGMTITINCSDMYAAQEMEKEIQKVQESRTFIREFEKTPYDKRKEMFSEGRPTPIELSDKQLKQISNLLRKLFFCAPISSTLFDDVCEDDLCDDEDI